MPTARAIKIISVFTALTVVWFISSELTEVEITDIFKRPIIVLYANVPGIIGMTPGIVKTGGGAKSFPEK